MVLHDTIFSILSQKRTGIFDVAPETPVFEALQLMAERDVGALIVTSGTELVGMFSERDYARKVQLAGKRSHYTRVSDVMSGPPIVASPHQSVGYCLALMDKHRIRHLPIVEYGTVTGIVSIGDLVKALVERKRKPAGESVRYETALAS